MCGEAVLWAGRTRFVAVSQAGPQPHSLKRFHLHLASSRPHPSSSHSLHLRSDHVPLLFKPFSGSHYPSVMTELLSVAFRALWFGLYWPLWPLLPVLCLLYQVPQGFLSTKLILPPDLAPRVDCLEPRKCKCNCNIVINKKYIFGPHPRFLKMLQSQKGEMGVLLLKG